MNRLALFLGLMGLLALVSTKSAPGLGKLRPATPDSGEETPKFWRTYAQRDLSRRLKVKENRGNAKNVIIFVGDGMGINTISLARIYKGQKRQKEGMLEPGEDVNGEGDSLVWEDFPVTGLSKTYNTNYQVTDSAGSACAMFSGVKTDFGVAGVDQSITRGDCDNQVYENAKLTTIMHWSADVGKKTGLVTTARVTHATPANLYAHAVDRNWEADVHLPSPDCHPDIAKQLVESDMGKKINVVFGGGRRNFILKDNPEGDPGKRMDEDLTEKWMKFNEQEQTSYRYIKTKGDLEKWASDGGTEKVLGLFSPSHMSYEIDRDDSQDGEPSLSDMAGAAVDQLEALSGDEGYFLMVEAGRIDHGHHATNAKRALEEAVEMDKAVQAVLDRIDTDETLLIVTADHSHSVTFNGYPVRGNPILGYSFEDPLSMSEYPDGTKRAYSTISYANGPGYHVHFTNDSAVPWADMRDMDYEDKDFLNPAMMPGPEKEESHGGEDVAIYAIGPQAHLLGGVHENNFLAHVMAYASCVGDYKQDCPK